MKGKNQQWNRRYVVAPPRRIRQRSPTQNRV